MVAALALGVGLALGPGPGTATPAVGAADGAAGGPGASGLPRSFRRNPAPLPLGPKRDGAVRPAAAPAPRPGPRREAAPPQEPEVPPPPAPPTRRPDAGVPATPPPADLRLVQPPPPGAGDAARGDRPDAEAAPEAAGSAPPAPAALFPDLRRAGVPGVEVPADPVPVSVPGQPEYPIDLSVALRLAEAENPEIAVARTEVLAALAERLAARVIALPTFNAGTNYHAHNGNLQRSSGRILSLSEQSLYVGGGARTLAAETLGIPAVNIVAPLADAWFEPLAAQQRLNAARFGVRATSNNVLLEVAVLYLDLLGARARLDALRVAEAQTAEIARVTRSYAEVGEGREADADRAEAEREIRRAEVHAAEGEIAAASARLARRLNLDPSVLLVPAGGPLAPLVLIDPASDQAQLTQVALRRRPELASNTAEIAEAQVRVRQEVLRPFMPLVWLGFSGGGFGGGSNLSLPEIGRFGGRTDFDVRVVWTLMNFGEGNLARQRRRRALVGTAVATRGVTINRVRREVAEALALSAARLSQIELAVRQLGIAENGFREDLERSRQNLGRAIEVLDNLELLTQARLELIRALTEFNQAQFRLYVALGSPPPLGQGPSTPASPPLNTPLHAPLRVDPLAEPFGHVHE
jgi:outer membrane protein TolC